MNERIYYVYILASQKNGTLYIGFTSNLQKRIWEHKSGVAEGFTQKYNVKNLVYFEIFSDPENAILREKKLKPWPRQWKVNIINESNPTWRDLYEDICK